MTQKRSKIYHKVIAYVTFSSAKEVVHGVHLEENHPVSPHF